MLRAVRFSAAFDFALEVETLAALREMAAQIVVVSPERIAMEMRRMLGEPGRAVAARLLVETGLAAAILPEIVPHDDATRQRLEAAFDVLQRLAAAEFPLALAALLDDLVDAAAAREIGLRWRLANKEIERVTWLVEHRTALAGARGMRWSQLQPLLLAKGIHDLLALHEIVAPAGAEEAAHCRALLRSRGKRSIRRRWSPATTCWRTACPPGRSTRPCSSGCGPHNWTARFTRVRKQSPC